MATTMAHSIVSRSSWDYRNALEGGSEGDKRSHEYTANFTTGTGTNQVQKPVHVKRTVANNTRDSLDLSGTTFQALGANVAFTKIKELKIENTGTVPLSVGGGTDGAGAAAFVGPFGAADVILPLPVGGLLHFVNPTEAGWPVTATTADILAVVNGDNDPDAAGSYKLTLVGV